MNPLDQNESSSGYEKTDANFGIIVKVGLVLILVTVFSCVAMLGMHLLLERVFTSLDKQAFFQHAVTDPQPPFLLQVNPSEDLKALRAYETERTQEFSWVQKTDGIARIPVHRAMQIIAEKGLPTRGTNE